MIHFVNDFLHIFEPLKIRNDRVKLYSLAASRLRHRSTERQYYHYVFYPKPAIFSIVHYLESPLLSISIA